MLIELQAEQAGDGDSEPAVETNRDFTPERHSYDVLQEMKCSSLSLCFGALIAVSTFGEAVDPNRAVVEPQLSDYSIPINDTAKEAIALILKHLNCSLSEYLQRSGIIFPVGAKCSIEATTNTFKATLDHEESTKLVMILGHLMFSLREPMTSQQILEKYAVIPEPCFPSANTNKKKENKSEMATPRKPSD